MDPLKMEVLGIIISLVFVFLLYSLLATILQEFLAIGFRFRAKILERAIYRMLQDEEEYSSAWKAFFDMFKPSGKSSFPQSMFQLFYYHPMVYYLGASDRYKSKPSYIKKETFSKVMIDLLKGEVVPGENERHKIQKALNMRIVGWSDFKADEESDLLATLANCIYSKTGDNEVSVRTELEKLSARYQYDDQKLTGVAAKKKITPKAIQADLGLIFKQFSSSSDGVEKNGTLDSEVRRYIIYYSGHERLFTYLRGIWADAQGDIVKFKYLLEQWFEETMDRATGWYRTHTRYVLFLLGGILAVVFNVNTFEIVSKLEKDPKLREQIIRQASEFTEAHPDLEQDLIKIRLSIKDSSDIGETREIKEEALMEYRVLKQRRDSLFNRANMLVNNDIKSLNGLLGIGLKSVRWPKITTQDTCTMIWQFISNLIYLIGGWLITALAISLGAPFWFDLLNKLMKLRTSVTANSNGTPSNAEKSSSQVVPVIEREG